MWILCFVNLWISYQQNSGYENNNHRFLKDHGSYFTPNSESYHRKSYNIVFFYVKIAQIRPYALFRRVAYLAIPTQPEERISLLVE
jgi:hypothetical protein